MADYVTADQVAAFAQEFDSLDPAGQELIVTAASRLFDNLADVSEDFFAPATGAYSEKRFYGNGTAYLRLPPYVTLASEEPIIIVNNDDDEESDIPEYFEQNGYLVIKGYGAGVPTRDASDALLVHDFDGWPLNYEITIEADWGLPEVPFDVQMAVIQLAIHIWRTSDPAFTVISQSGEAYTPPAVPAQAKEIAERYRMKYSQKAYFA